MQSRGHDSATTLRVLLVDRHRDEAEMYAMSLEVIGVQVELSPDPEAALAVLARSPVDAVVCDVILPGPRLPDWVRDVRAAGGPRGRMPVIALVSLDTPDYVRGLVEAGFDAHRVKPLLAVDLVALVRRLLVRLEEDDDPSTRRPSQRPL